MIQTQLALIKREMWEHRSIYVVLVFLVALTSVTGQVAVSSFDQEVDLAILGATNLSETERSMAINLLMLGVSWLFCLTMLALTYFYALDALYAERKDKSILFWRSLPVTDSETVVSKLLTAVIVIPAITFVAIALTHLLVLTISSVWIGMRGVDAWGLIWGAAPLLQNWVATFVVLVALPIWSSPFIGWFLFVSAFAKRSPFLLAALPLIVIPMLEKSLLGSWVFGDMLMQRTPFNMPVVKELNIDQAAVIDGDDLMRLVGSTGDVLGMIDIGRFLSSPSMWLGMAVCGLFCAAAIYVRRYRDDS